MAENHPVHLKNAEYPGDNVGRPTDDEISGGFDERLASAIPENIERLRQRVDQGEFDKYLEREN